jgi:hypothetical protein
MHILTKNQKIENVEELMKSKNEKIERLSKELNFLKIKLQKLKDSEETSQENQDLVKEFNSYDPTKQI